jgi:hypothetical protein
VPARTWHRKSGQALLLFASSHAKVGAYERLQVAVDHAIHISNFELGAVIFDHPVRLQNVRANL